MSFEPAALPGRLGEAAVTSDLLQAGHRVAVGGPKKIVSSLVNRNVVVFGIRSSMRMEPYFWEALREICHRERVTLAELIDHIAAMRTEGTITSAVRVYAIEYFRSAATNQGHRLAGHGTLQ